MLPEEFSLFFFDFRGDEKLLFFLLGEGEISTAPLTGDLEYLPRALDPENPLGASSNEGDLETDRLPRLLIGEILRPLGEGDLGFSFRPTFLLFLLLCDAGDRDLDRDLEYDR